jgi:putative ABC transport system ATP-binding protein
MMASTVSGVDEGPLFEFEEVSVVADGFTILDRVTAQIPLAGITAVVGPSGAGKSTLLRLCNRLEVPSAGMLRFKGEALDGIDPLQLRRKVGMVFQRPTLFAGNVRENLEVAAPDLDLTDYEAALSQAALDPQLLERSAQDLSGGEAQRLCLARSLMAGPEVLLMDEPTSSVDRVARDAIEERSRQLNAAGTAVVWVTHDLEQMRRLCDHAVVLVAGRVKAVMSVAELGGAENAAVREFLADPDQP